MRGARVARLDPGGGSFEGAAVLVGAEEETTSLAASLPGHVAGVFLTAPTEVRGQQELAATLKQKPRRGAQTSLDPLTARMFRYDDEREKWVLVDASGWNAKDKYVWGRVRRVGLGLPR